MSRNILVYDIGGTNLRCGYFCIDSGKLIRRFSTPTPNFSKHANLTFNEFRDKLLQEIRQIGDRILKGETPGCVSIAFPGPIDADGKIISAPTVWGKAENQPVHLKPYLDLIWPDTDVYLLNDVTAAGYNYLRSPEDELCIVTVSSGIGHKVFVDGRPIVGSGGRGGEIGHLLVDASDNAPYCECGHRGHLAAIASGRASSWQAQKLAFESPSDYENCLIAQGGVHPAEITNKEIVRTFHLGDPWSTTLINRMAKPLGNVLAGIHLTVGIERFVVVGGFATALGENYRRLLVKWADRSCWRLGVDWNSMIDLECDANDTGLTGAALHARSMLNSKEKIMGVYG